MPKHPSFLDHTHTPEIHGCILKLFEKFKGRKEIDEKCKPYMPVHKCRFFVQNCLFLISIKGYLIRWEAKLYL
jgi:hypothetical protein